MVSVSLSAEGRARLDKHLDAVEAALAAAGNSRERRRGVVDDLEAQIQEMLTARSATPTLEDVEAVLATLDPPDAYREAGGVPGVAAPREPPPRATPASRPRYSRTAVVGLAAVLLSLLLLPTVLFHPAGPEYVSYSAFMGALQQRRIRAIVVEDRGNVCLLTGSLRTRPGSIATLVPATSLDGSGFEVLSREARQAGTDLENTVSTGAMGRALEVLGVVLAALCVVLALVGTVLGWVAFVRIRRSGGLIRGLGLALVDGLFCPVVALLLVIFVWMASG